MFTVGDLLILELAMASYLKGIDISMQAGQQCSAIIGKLEYQISQLVAASNVQATDALNPKAGG